MFGSGVHINVVTDGEDEESEERRRPEIPEDLKRKLAEKRINDYDDPKIKEGLWKMENQRRKEVEVEERKTLINQCMKRTRDIEDASKKIWEQIKEELKKMEKTTLDKDLKIPIELSELEEVQLDEVLCIRENYFY